MNNTINKYQFVLLCQVQSLYHASVSKVHIFLLRFGQPSIVTLISLSHFSSSVSLHAFTSFNNSLLVVVPFIDLIAASASLILNSYISPRRNTSSCAVSRTSQLSSKAREKKSKLPTPLLSLSWRFSTMSFTLLVIVRLDSGTFSNASFSLDILALQSPPSTLSQVPPPKMADSFLLFCGISYHKAGLGCCILGCV